MKLEFPEFRARAPWLGPDLQTLRNVLSPPRDRSVPAKGERVAVALPDGDSLSVWVETPDVPLARPLLVLLHGLGGTEESPYVARTARHFLSHGYTVARANMRGAGPSRELCRAQYHAGLSDDLGPLVEKLGERHGEHGVVLTGYSLGGNVLLKFLAESGARLPVRAAVTVSAPIDLAQASRRFHHARNRIYHRYILAKLKRQTLAEPGISSERARLVRGIPSVHAFDQAVVARDNGFVSAEAYYEASSAARALDAIDVPTLLIHARNDPWIPARAYTERKWSRNPRLVPLLPNGGGHVGFHGVGSAVPWFDRCAEVFFRRLCA